MHSDPPPADARISIDVDGDWYYNDLPIVNQTVLAFLQAHVTAAPGECRLEARLNDQTREPFDIAGLHLRDTGIPYSRVKQGRFPARLRRQAWNSLTPLIEHDPATDTYRVCTGGQHYPLEILPAGDR